jgi:hypothetical protein
MIVFVLVASTFHQGIAEMLQHPAPCSGHVLCSSYSLTKTTSTAGFVMTCPTAGWQTETCLVVLRCPCCAVLCCAVQWVTHAFCHANWQHLSMNLFNLCVFGKVCLC